MDKFFAVRLVFVTQLVDPDSSILGFVPGWLHALSKRCEVVVIANEVRNLSRESGFEVISLGKERGEPRWRRAVRYQSTLLRLCRQFKPAALLAHMSPVYLIHAYPLARVFGISLALWFVHPSRSKSLVLAESFGDTILTALPGSYPGDSPKLRPIGHGIDVTALQQIPPQLNGDILELVSLGRTSPVKDYPTALRGLALLTQSGLRVRFSIFGDSITPIEARHRKELVKVAEGLGVREFFRLLDGVPHSEIGNVLGGADLLLNGNAGGADKVIFEAMAAGKPVVTSNRQFGHMMPNPEALLFEPGDPVSLASKIERFAAMSPPERAHLGATLRLRVIKEHSLERWADKVVAALSE